MSRTRGRELTPIQNSLHQKALMGFFETPLTIQMIRMYEPEAKRRDLRFAGLKISKDKSKVESNTVHMNKDGKLYNPVSEYNLWYYTVNKGE